MLPFILFFYCLLPTFSLSSYLSMYPSISILSILSTFSSPSLRIRIFHVFLSMPEFCLCVWACLAAWWLSQDKTRPLINKHTHKHTHSSTHTYSHILNTPTVNRESRSSLLRRSYITIACLSLCFCLLKIILLVRLRWTCTVVSQVFLPSAKPGRVGRI